jgi:hypothetical protein
LQPVTVTVRCTNLFSGNLRRWCHPILRTHERITRIVGWLRLKTGINCFLRILFRFMISAKLSSLCAFDLFLFTILVHWKSFSQWTLYLSALLTPKAYFLACMLFLIS